MYPHTRTKLDRKVLSTVWDFVCLITVEIARFLAVTSTSASASASASASTSTSTLTWCIKVLQQCPTAVSVSVSRESLAEKESESKFVVPVVELTRRGLPSRDDTKQEYDVLRCVFNVFNRYDIPIKYGSLSARYKPMTMSGRLGREHQLGYPFTFRLPEPAGPAAVLRVRTLELQ